MNTQPLHIAFGGYSFIAAVVIALFTGLEHTAYSQKDPDLPSKLLERPDVSYEGPFRAYPNRVIHRRPTLLIFPGNSENSVLEGGVLSQLKKYPKITGLRLYGGSKTSDISSASFIVDITPEAVADIGVLTHLESLSITKVDLTRGDGLKFLEPLTELREIEINNCGVEYTDVLAHLPVCRHLEVIRLFYVPKMDSGDSPATRRIITAKRTRKLVEDSPDLSVLFLRTTEQYEPATIAHFAELKSLSTLHIVYPYHQWTVNKRLVRLDRPSSSSRQKGESKKLKALFEAKGLRRWISPPFQNTYRIPAYMISATEPDAPANP